MEMETEAKEEGLDVANEVSAQSPDPAEPNSDGTAEEIQEVDYTQLGKKELVDMLKEMVRTNDFLRSEASLRELRSKVEDIQHQEKTEALKRFLENGGVLDDFDYRQDVLDIAF